jgi:hypothetical protein
VTPLQWVFAEARGEAPEMTQCDGRAPRGEWVRVPRPTSPGNPLIPAGSAEGLWAAIIVLSPTDGDVPEAYLGQVSCPQPPAHKRFEPLASSLLRPFS